MNVDAVAYFRNRICKDMESRWKRKKCVKGKSASAPLLKHPPAISDKKPERGATAARNQA